MLQMAMKTKDEYATKRWQRRWLWKWWIISII